MHGNGPCISVKAAVLNTSMVQKAGIYIKTHFFLQHSEELSSDEDEQEEENDEAVNYSRYGS